MKKLLIVASVALLLSGCKIINSKSSTEFYERGELVAVAHSKTISKGLLVKASAVDISGSATNQVVVTNGTFTYSSGKAFGAAEVINDPDEAAVEAGGAAAGKVIGEAAKAIVKP